MIGPRQYTEASKCRSTARPPRRRAWRPRWRTLATALLAALTLAAACPTAGAPAQPPASVVLSDAAAPYYSLQLSADRRQWVAVFADAAELTLKVARGPLAAAAAEVSSVITIDRIDVPPGINPYFGRHAYVQHEGVEHLFYSDQELADVRVTKWVHRETASAAPWLVDLLPEPLLPVAVLRAAPAPADAEPAPAAPNFTLYGLVDAPVEEDGGVAFAAYGVRPEAAADSVAAAVTGRRLIVTVAAPDIAPGAAGPAVSGYSCAGRRGFAAADGGGLLLVEAAREPQRISLPPPAAAAGGSAALGCGPQGMVLAFTREDPRATRTSSGPALQAREVVAVPVDAGGAEIKVTLARDVRVLAVFPEPPLAGGGQPALSVLFSELALDDSGAPEHRLALVTPDAGGTYRKQLLARGGQPVRDLRAVRRGGELIVAFRRGRELRLLHAALAGPGAAEPQSGGSW